jgi:hypothetical protein
MEINEKLVLSLNDGAESFHLKLIMGDDQAYHRPAEGSGPMPNFKTLH